MLHILVQSCLSICLVAMPAHAQDRTAGQAGLQNGADQQPTVHDGAAEQPAPRWSLQLDPLTLALGFVHVQVERALGDKLSIYAGPSVRLWDLASEDDDPSYYGVGVEVGLRYYFRGQPTDGTWIMVRGVAASLRSENEVTDFGGYASVLVGHHFVLGERWLLGLGGGVQYLDYTVDGAGTDGVLPAAHTTIGTVF